VDESSRRVVDRQGDPVANVRVKLKSADTYYSFDGDPPDAQVSSGDQGKFEFSTVSPGHWHLLAEGGNLMAFAPFYLGTPAKTM
jgi:protocatechuate 3,4-dioxygenase beta subunit